MEIVELWKQNRIKIWWEKAFLINLEFRKLLNAPKCPFYFLYFKKVFFNVSGSWLSRDFKMSMELHMDICKARKRDLSYACFGSGEPLSIKSFSQKLKILRRCRDILIPEYSFCGTEEFPVTLFSCKQSKFLLLYL